MADTTLQNTMSGTKSGSKPLNTADAKLRRRLIEVQNKYKDEEFTKRALYQIDNYDPEDIQSEMDRYKQMVEGTPIPQDEETGRLENRSRQMMYNFIASEINAVDPEDVEAGPMFSNAPGEKEGLINAAAQNFEDLSIDEIIGAVNERLPQQEEAPIEEENVGSDFTFGALDPRKEGSLWSKTFGKFGTKTEEVPENPSRLFQPPQQQVKGARFDRFVQGVEDRLPKKRMTIDNTQLGEPPSIEGIGVVNPPYPPAEERYPDKNITGDVSPGESSANKARGTNYDPYDREQTDLSRKPEDVGKGSLNFLIDDTMVAAAPLEGTEKPFVPYGTVIHVPQLGKNFLVADLLGPDSQGKQQFDFATPHKGKEIIPQFNQDFDYFVVREGKGPADARKFVQSEEWSRLKSQQNT